MDQNHAAEITQGQRFEFGANWARFLNVLDENRIDQAVASLTAMLGVTDLKGKRFLDAGSGSGLFSLANSAPTDLLQLNGMLRNSVRRIRGSQSLLWSCIHASDLPWAR